MGQLVFQATLGGAVNLIGPNIASTVNFTLPSADGSSGQALTTNGSGVLSFATVTTGAAGSNTQVQYNSSGAFAGSANLTFNGTTLTAANTSITTSETLSYGTANGVTYLNGSKVLTSGSALTFDGTTFALTGGLISASKGSANGITIGDVSTNSNSVLRMQGTSAGYNWQIANNLNIAGIEFTPSTATGGTTYTTPALALTSTTLYTGSGINVGIGTSSPLGTLGIAGSATTTIVIPRSSNGTTGTPVETQLIGSTFTNGSYGAGIYALNAFNSSSANWLTFKTTDVGNGSPVERMRLDSAGNLGLGVTPSAWSSLRAIEGFGGSFFATQSGISAAFIGTNTYFNGTNWIYKTTGVPATYSQQYQGAHSWYTAPSGTAGTAITFTQAATLTAIGNYLLGTTSDLAGTPRMSIAYDQSSGYGITLKNTNSGNSTNFIYFTNSSNGGAGSISQNGATGVLYNITSDYRLKTVIGAVTGHGERIDALEPIEYEWKFDGSRTRGFLAHKFQEVYASSVTGTKDAVDADGNPVYQQMQASTSEVIADLVAEIQSLRQRLAAANI